MTKSGEEKPILKINPGRGRSKGFAVAEDPVALAWYDDKTGQGEIGPEKPWQQKRS